MEYKNISVKIVADSISPQGVRLTTYELDYPRYIHAEILTHRVFSRNAQSSRAVPVKKALEMESITPIVWGKNQAGMSSSEQLDGIALESAKRLWEEAVSVTKIFSQRLADIGLHKQWANRMTEWFSPIKVVVTATEWDNFFWLRDDPEAAQPEIVELARQMKMAMDNSVPQNLDPGDWHLPYVRVIKQRGKTMYGLPQNGGDDYIEIKEIDLETAKKISASCCAQASYRRLDTSLEKALDIYSKLFSGAKPHLSPVEHQATPMEISSAWVEDIDWPGQTEFLSPYDWEKGITHSDRDGNFFSGNLRGWIQMRQVI